jgi:hypothetical protein
MSRDIGGFLPFPLRPFPFTIRRAARIEAPLQSLYFFDG